MTTPNTSTATPPVSPILDLDLDHFAKVGAIASQIASLCAVDGAPKALGIKMAAMLSDHIDNAFPQANKFNLAVANRRAVQSDPAKVAASATEVKATYNKLWHDIHTNALANPPGHDDSAFLASIGDALDFKGACPACRMNYLAWVKKNKPDFSTPDSYFAWTVALHNQVNLTASPKKPVMSLVNAKALYAAV